MFYDADEGFSSFVTYFQHGTNQLGRSRYLYNRWSVLFKKGAGRHQPDTEFVLFIAIDQQA